MLTATIEFLLITLFLEITPGPAVLFVVYQSSYGLKNALLGIAGLLTANLIWLSLVTTGLGLIITKSPLAFDTLRWAGAAYLAYLGYKIIRNGLGKPGLSTTLHSAQHSKTYLKGVLVSLSNPKALIFFLALFPNFTRPEHFLQDMAYFGGLKMACLLIVMSSYALIGQRIFNALNSTSLGAIISKALGAAVILAAVAIARS